MTRKQEWVRLVRIFVSSPGDVVGERSVLDEVVSGINRTDGEAQSVRLETFRWEKNVVPRIGPRPQKVVDHQTLSYDIYLGILSKRFGTPTDGYGSGTENEFRDAYRRWGKTGSPWILFYFDDSRQKLNTEEEIEQYLLVFRFKKELMQKGLVGTYKGVRGREEGFYERVQEHLRMILQRYILAKPAAQPHRKVSMGKAAVKPTVPQSYRDWLKIRCGDIELLGLSPKEAQAVRLRNVYVPLTTPAGSEAPQERQSESRSETVREEKKPQLLLGLLERKSLYVSGAPGSGKSTFCRWAAWLACAGEMPDHPVVAPEPFAEVFPVSFAKRLPLLIRLSQFWTYLPQTPGCRDLSHKQFEQALSRWLQDQNPGGMKWPVVRANLDAGSALLLFDGVDEVPLTHGDERSYSCPRAMLISGLTAGIADWTRRGNRVLVTSRPYGVEETDVRRLGIDHAPIEDLAMPLQDLLIQRWFQILASKPEFGQKTAAEMIDHLRGREELAPLAANPMLLTAICIIYHEGRRLPQDKAELYTRTVENVLYHRYPIDSRVVDPVRNRLNVIAYDGSAWSFALPRAQPGSGPGFRRGRPLSLPHSGRGAGWPGRGAARKWRSVERRPDLGRARV